MIFSQWQPHGGYKYFEADVHHPIGDDLPDVRLPPPSGGIGVPAQDVGRDIPSDAVFVGEGDAPQGVIAPMSRAQRRGLSGANGLSTTQMVVVLFVTGVLLVGGIASMQDGRRRRRS